MPRLIKRGFSILKREDGAIAVIAAISLTVVLSLCALALDVGVLYLDRSRLQNALDAAALAGAHKLPDTTAARDEALSYAELNGVPRGDVSVSFDGADKIIRVSGSYTTASFFARFLSQDTLFVSASAGAEKYEKSVGGPFEYKIFSGSAVHEFRMGGSYNINGSIHSNGTIFSSPSNGVLSGAGEACGSVYFNPWTTTTGSQASGVPFIEMVDFTSVEDDNRPTKPVLPARPADYITIPAGNQAWVSYPVYDTYTYIPGTATINCSWININRPLHVNGSLAISGGAAVNDTTLYVNGNLSIGNKATIRGKVYVNGDLTISGGSPVCTLDGEIYVTGNINFGNSFTGSGSLYAGGNITMSGSANVMDGVVFTEKTVNFGNSFKGEGYVIAGQNINFSGGLTQVDTAGTVCVYSRSGNIQMPSGSTVINGIVYAPMGTVQMAGNINVSGSIVGNVVSGVPATLVVGDPDGEFEFMPRSGGVRLVE